MDKNFIIKYKTGDEIITTSETENDLYSLEVTDNKDRFSVILKPKQTFELVDFFVEYPYEFKAGDNFFAAGYQSWTKSREFRCSDIQPGAAKAANINKHLQYLIRMTSDEWFVDYSNQPGEFNSHCYTYIRNGKNVKLWGSLSEKTGFTYFKVKMNAGYFSIHKDVLGKIVSDDLTIFDIVYFEGGYDEVFDKYFSMMKMPETRNGHMSGYTSWYNYFQKIDENIILRDLNGLDPAKEEVSIFQVDDGYETFVGDWLDPNPAKFPNGMKYIADKIHEKGYKAGIWIAPFNCQKVSKIAAAHPEWLIRDEDGKPQLGCIGWGGAYTFDIYNDDARDYIRSVFDAVLNDWGYDMVKLDFLYSQCITPRNGKCRGEIMYEALKFLRECVGDKLILGCGVPMGPAFGIVDACRISCDVASDYKGKIYNHIQLSNEMLSAQSAINNAIFRRHLNGRVFMNDPDVFFLRTTNIKFTNRQKILLATINNLCGSVLFVSDNAGDYDEHQMKLLKKFFTKTNQKVTAAEYLTDDIIKLKLDDNGKKKTLTFNIKDGNIIKNNY